MAGERVKAQLHTSSGRSSKILKDRQQVEACVEVEGVGKLVLNVDGRGGYSLRGYPDKGDVAPGGGLLAVGVMHAEVVEAIHLRGSPNTQIPENSPSAHPGE